MKGFIQDHTGLKCIKISHISTVQIVPWDCERRGNITFRLYAVEVTLKSGNKHILKKGFKDIQTAKEWMKGLGFLKTKKEEI